MQRRPFTRDRKEESGNGSGRPPFRRFDAPRGPRTDGGEGRSSFPKRPFYGRGEGSSASGAPARPSFGKREGGFAGKKPFGDRKPGGFAGKAGGGFAGKPGSAGKRPFSRPGGPPAAGETPFDKFKGGNKPWGNRRPPARKFKPGAGDATGPSAGSNEE